MLINLNNKRWVNKYQIITVDISYIVGKGPSLLHSNMLDTLREEFEEENSFYLEICKEQFEIEIGVCIDILFEQKRVESIALPLHRFTTDNLDLDLKTKEDYINLFIATAQLIPEWYTIDVVDNDTMNYFNNLLNNEDTTNILGIQHHLEKYYADKEKDEKLNGLINRIKKEVHSLYRRTSDR